MDGKNKTNNSSMDWVQRATDLIPAIDAASERIDAERRIAPEIMSAMHEAELFRMCLPRSMGGGEVARRTTAMQCEALEAGEVHLLVERKGRSPAEGGKGCDNQRGMGDDNQRRKATMQSVGDQCE